MMFLNACAWVFGSGALLNIAYIIYQLSVLSSNGFDIDKIVSKVTPHKSILILIVSVIWLVFGGK